MAVMFALTVVSMVFTVIIPALIPSIPMPLLVIGHVLMVVPVILYKVDALAAGVVCAAVPAPVSSVSRRYV